ncbi:hypothetical protein HMPREF0972_00843 [Actinomyces sp. oral taxon 848 str. F0332]|nr:hypothetical protein HMPREF0972_00843 [Actinomyces sp. oral taxon 848 str. F0332]
MGAATSAETVLEKLLKSKETLVQAGRCDADVLLTYIDDNGGSAMRREVDQKAEGLFDNLLAIVADGLAGLAQTSQDFPRNAFLVALDNHNSLMGGQSHGACPRTRPGPVDAQEGPRRDPRGRLGGRRAPGQGQPGIGDRLRGDQSRAGIGGPRAADSVRFSSGAGSRLHQPTGAGQA